MLSEQDLSLRALSTELARQTTFLVGEAMTPALRQRAEGIANLFCTKVKQRWGINLTPIVEWNEADGIVALDAKPVDEMDEAMWLHIQELEGIA